MKILYNNLDGKIFYVVPDKDWFYFRHTTNIPLAELQIDEIAPENQDTCLDLVRTLNKTDINGQGKYYIENGELYSRDGWEPYEPEDIMI